MGGCKPVSRFGLPDFRSMISDIPDGDHFSCRQSAVRYPWLAARMTEDAPTVACSGPSAPRVAGLAGPATVSRSKPYVGRIPRLQRREQAVDRTFHGQRGIHTFRRVVHHGAVWRMMESRGVLISSAVHENDF